MILQTLGGVLLIGVCVCVCVAANLNELLIWFTNWSKVCFGSSSSAAPAKPKLRLSWFNSIQVEGGTCFKLELISHFLRLDKWFFFLILFFLLFFVAAGFSISLAFCCLFCLYLLTSFPQHAARSRYACFSLSLIGQLGQGLGSGIRNRFWGSQASEIMCINFLEKTAEISRHRGGGEGGAELRPISKWAQK